MYFSFSVDYTLYGKINYILPEFEIKLLDTEFADNVTITLLVRSEQFDSMAEKLKDTSNGMVILSKGTELFENFA